MRVDPWQRIKRLAIGVAVFGAVGLLFVFASDVRMGVQEGLALCGQVVIPSLFVFLCLCYWMIGSDGLTRATDRSQWFFRLLLGNGYAGGTALLLGLLGGYPVGAAVLKEGLRRGRLTALQVKRLALWICFPSPAFGISAVGLGMFHSVKAGVLVWSAAVLPALVATCFAARKIPLAPKKKENVSVVQTDGFSQGLQQACQTILQICGVVVLGRTALVLLQKIPFPFGPFWGWAAVIEVTNGCMESAASGLALVAAVMGFGGVCTHLQIKGILGEYMPSYSVFLLARLLQSVTAYGLAKWFCRWFPRAVPTVATGFSVATDSPSLLPSIAVVLTCFVFLGWMECSAKNKEMRV